MREDAYPVRWAGQQAVVRLPELIAVSNAGQIREELLAVINRGAAELIADMTATTSCDHAGADALARAHQRAVLVGAELCLVVSAPVVRRVLAFSGLDRLVSVYPSLEAAAAKQELLDRIVHNLFSTALSLQVAINEPGEVARPHITEALQGLDDTIREIRDHAYTTCLEARTRPAPPDRGR